MTKLARRLAVAPYRSGTPPGGGDPGDPDNASGFAIPDMSEFGFQKIFEDDFDAAPYSANYALDPELYSIFTGNPKSHATTAYWMQSHVKVRDSMVVLENYKDTGAPPPRYYDYNDDQYKDYTGKYRQVGGTFTTGRMSDPSSGQGLTGYPNGLPANLMFLWCVKQDDAIATNTVSMTYGAKSTTYPDWPATGEDDTEENRMGASTTVSRLHYPTSPWTSGTVGNDSNSHFPPDLTVDLNEWHIGGTSVQPGASGQGPTIKHWCNNLTAVTNEMSVVRTRTDVFPSYGAAKRRFVAQSEAITTGVFPVQHTGSLNHDGKYDGWDQDPGAVVVSCYYDWLAIYVYNP